MQRSGGLPDQYVLVHIPSGRKIGQPLPSETQMQRFLELVSTMANWTHSYEDLLRLHPDWKVLGHQVQEAWHAALVGDIEVTQREKETPVSITPV